MFRGRPYSSIRSAGDKDLMLFRASFLLNNTALVMPILPYWWTDNLAIPMSTYLSVLATVSIGALILDIPFSIVADRVGIKYTYMAGLGLFSLSFLIAAVWNSILSFYWYAFINTFAEALLAGANNAMLKAIVGEKSCRDELYRLNRWYYLATSVLFFVGVGLYLALPRLLLLIQFAMLFSACLMVAQMHAGKSATHAQENTSPHGLKDAATFVRGSFNKKPNRKLLGRYCGGVLALCALFGFFNGVMQFQNRTIQLISGQFSLFNTNSLWTVALLLFIGNVITSLGVGKKVEKLLRVIGVVPSTAVFLAVAALAGLLLSLDLLVGSAFGYFLICILKGAYRAEYSDIALRTAPSSEFTASWLSVVNTAASLVGSAINLAIGLFVGESLATTQLAWSLGAIICGLLCIPLLLCSRGARIPYMKSGLSGKDSYIQFFFTNRIPACLVQVYPEAQYCESLRRRYALARRKGGLRMAGLIDDSGLGNARSETVHSREVFFELLPYPDVMELRPGLRWGAVEQTGLIDDLLRRENVQCHAAADVVEVPRSNLVDAAAELCTCKTVCHGDLNPTNILVRGDHYALVDWDQSGIGPRVLDEFSLVFHPDYELAIDARVNLLRDFTAAHELDCPLHGRDIESSVSSLLKAKRADCLSWASTPESRRLCDGYAELEAQLYENDTNYDN